MTLAEIQDFLGVSLKYIEAHPHFFLNFCHAPAYSAIGDKIGRCCLPGWRLVNPQRKETHATGSNRLRHPLDSPVNQRF
ncbi:hypothetical protein HMPREF0580_0618 [Mobiluncus mulieris ATCC 35239]|uniref:Uncharacterized protein n=1 Tax=Mobiluncus mulieris ATCC 35239 TaxID=871571 RepID=E0QP04_9ACTO|nr:hypothetical protein HMPREF0580_0618 [Mobiluncus mulieris ATCC 35239]MCU9971614.1 hypothetical protein [Mobiluncus mulieris]MCU9976152.1 hypothetical protein [Mobiluncus mulieris]MCU9994543.1 hypothetical protein [Mobiluncus mulieris]MCU9996957.1 hypothetical protein [Mobiluncus mulieris]